MSTEDFKEAKELLKNETTGLDEREQYFLDILFDQCSGDFVLAMKEAGYSSKTPIGEIRRKLSKEIKKASKEYLVSLTPKAAVNLGKVFDSPNAIGARNVISAAKEILDRGDVNKEDTVHEVSDQIVILLPAKRTDD